MTLKLGNLHERLNRLTDAYLDQMFDKQAFEERRTSLLFEEKAIEDRMREIRDGKRSLPDRFDKFLELVKPYVAITKRRFQKKSAKYSVPSLRTGP